LQGSELAYIYACLFLGFVPIVCAGAGYGVVKLQNRRRRLRIQQEELKNSAEGKTSVYKMAVREWLHANHRRLVKVMFGPEAAIHTVDRKGEKLRTVNFRTCEALTVEESQVRLLVY
jgi:dual oxidase